MEEATPRGMIRGVLTTASIRKSSRKNRNTPRAANDKDTPANHPSHSEIATRILTRSQSRSLNKKKAAFAFQTPTDLTTPRTLVRAHKSNLKLIIYITARKQHYKVGQQHLTALCTSQIEASTSPTPPRAFPGHFPGI